MGVNSVRSLAPVDDKPPQTSSLGQSGRVMGTSSASVRSLAPSAIQRRSFPNQNDRLSRASTQTGNDRSRMASQMSGAPDSPDDSVFDMDDYGHGRADERDTLADLDKFERQRGGGRGGGESGMGGSNFRGSHSRRENSVTWEDDEDVLDGWEEVMPGGTARPTNNFSWDTVKVGTVEPMGLSGGEQLYQDRQQTLYQSTPTTNDIHFLEQQGYQLLQQQQPLVFSNQQDLVPPSRAPQDEDDSRVAEFSRRLQEKSREIGASYPTPLVFLCLFHSLSLSLSLSLSHTHTHTHTTFCCCRPLLPCC